MYKFTFQKLKKWGQKNTKSGKVRTCLGNAHTSDKEVDLSLKSTVIPGVETGEGGLHYMEAVLSCLY